MLTDTQIKKTKPDTKAFKLSDSGGLYLQVTPAGGKLWLRIPMKPAIDSETKPATCSDFIPASIPI